MSAYRLAYINIKDIIVFAALKMKDIYDFYYKSIFFKVEDQVNLRLYRDYRILAIKSKKLNSQFIKLFLIIERIDRLIYRLRLLSIIKIYNVILITHLELVIDLIKDSY